MAQELKTYLEDESQPEEDWTSSKEAQMLGITGANFFILNNKFGWGPAQIIREFIQNNS